MWKRIRLYWKQLQADRAATKDLIGYVEGKVVQGELKRIEAKLSARIDALELYVEDVTDKYMKKGFCAQGTRNEKRKN